MSDMWLDRLEWEMRLRGAVILSGNTNDIILNPQKAGQYTSVVDCVRDIAFKSGYERVIMWNRAEGGSSWERGASSPTGMGLEGVNVEEPKGGTDYDMGLSNETEQSNANNKYARPSEFFPQLRLQLENKSGGTATIVDYSDYLFGDGRSLSDEERNNITNMMIGIAKSQDYGLNFARDNGNLLVLVAKTTAMLPPSVYVDNPLVATINVPMPARDERAKYVEKDINLLKLSPGIEDKTVRDNFIDALDGFSLKNIAQIIKLSSQIPERMSFEKIINLYRYGEKKSPWEELSYEKLKTAKETLGQRVKGQNEAVQKVRDVIIRAYTGFAGLQHSAKQKKPKGALFFVGPTGVGKTDLAKSLAEFVFGDESAYRRFDMSEYAHEQSDQRLVGAPPGYVGYEKGGELTNAVKEKPFCVLLFDEIEKAHGRIMDKFLQILEDGRLTDGKGETVYFSETFIIFTSNIGAANADVNWDTEQTREYFIEKVKEHFINELKRPEILNRIGDANIVPFNFIQNDQVLVAIGKSKFTPIREFVKERYKADIRFDDEDDALNALGKSVNKANGGRGMLNAMEQKLINPLSDFVFEKMETLERGGRTIKVNIEKTPHGEIEFDFCLD